MAKTYSYIGKGKIYLKAKGAAEGLKRIGNCSALNFSVETANVSQPDYENAGGGEASSVDRISTVGMGLTMLELSPTNLKLALRASVRAVAASVVTDERHTGYVESLIPFVDTPDLTQTITVTEDPDGSPVVWTADVDYEVTGAGIVLLEGGAALDGDVLKVAYTAAIGDVVEAMTGTGEEYTLVFDGLNEAESGAAVVVTVHKAKFTPTSGMELIGDAYGSLALEGTVLSDATITGSNISRYFKAAMVEPA